MTNGLQGVLRQVEALLRAGNLAQAMIVAKDAADQGIVHPNLLTLAAMRELESGMPDKALAHMTQARELAPRNPDVLNVLGQALAGTGRHREALAAFDETLRQAPRHAAAHYNKALSLAELHEQRRAEREFERVVDIEPRHAAALARLAAIAASRGEADKARGHALRALAVNPREAAAHIALAQTELGAGEFDAVRERLAPIMNAPFLGPTNRSIAEGLLADALDGAGKPAEAFAHYARSNAILREVYRRAFEVPGTERAVDRARRLADFLRSADPWRDAKADTTASPVPTHVFLVGFPRSGTTLLEQVLSSHEDIESLEERDCLALAMSDFVMPPDGMRRLSGLSGDALAPYRKAYWDEVRAGGAALDGPVFIDKLPLNAMNLALIAKLFPDAKILLALRDPRDVVLSCFRRRFQMSPNMYEFLALDDAARFYDAVMEICELASEKLSLDFHVSRYEDLVADLPARARALCGFLGLSYDGAMQDFAAKARARGINTPSAAQVARGLYGTGVNQWRAYRAQLAPVLPVLAPWVSRYGYEEA